MTSYVLCGPQGIGKTRRADQLAAALGCTTVLDDWNGDRVLPDGVLAVTNDCVYFPAPGSVGFHVEDAAGLNALMALIAPEAPRAA